MRRSIFALAAMGFIPSAYAADYGDLRGTSSYDPPATYTRYVPGQPVYSPWSGFYVGGQVGYAAGEMDFSEASESLVASTLRETALQQDVAPSQWEVLGTDGSRSAVYGAFFGYNAQWEDVVLGVEVNYNRASLSGSAPLTPLTRAVSAGGNAYVLTLEGAATLKVTDLATFRGRAGWVVDGYMPYVMAGLALGRADVTRSVRVSGVETAPGPIVTPFDFVESETKSGALMFGWTAGVGLDVMIQPRWFLRGEYEFASLRVSDIVTTLNTVRMGLGYRF